MKKLFYIFTALLIAISVNAATYYVRTDGSNSNNGLTNSAGGAWRTIDYAADNVSAGDVVRVQAGTYEENVTPGVSGTSSSNMVTFVADGAVTLRQWQLSSGQDFIRIIGFNVDNNDVANDCVYISGTNEGIELWNNTFQDANYKGINAAGPLTNSIFIGNTMHTTGIGNSSGQGASFANYSHILVAYNTIYNIDCDVFFTQGDYGRYLNNYVYGMLEDGGGHPDFFQNGNASPNFTYNLTEANIQIGSGSANDHGMNMENGQGASMYEWILRRNVFHNMGTVVLNAHSAGDGFTGTRYYNNTAVDLQRSENNNPAGHYFYGGDFATTYILNNIEYESWGSILTTGISVYDIEDTLVIDYNLAFDPDGSVTFAYAWEDQSSAQSNVDPEFTNYTNDDFTISTSSGARGAAGPLTTTSGSGTGTTFNVATGGGGFFRGDDTNIYQYGGNLVVGDTITVGTDVVNISSISSDAITVTESFTWANEENVYFGDDNNPDIGALPYRSGGYTYTATYSNSDGTIAITPSDSSLVRMVVVFEDGIPVGADSISPYSVSGVGSGTLSVRVYPLYASTTLYVEATDDETPVPANAIQGVQISNLNVTKNLIAWHRTDGLR